MKFVSCVDACSSMDSVLMVMASATITLKVHIQYQDQHGYWKHYQTQHHQPSAFRKATQRAHATGKRHRLVDEDECLIDLIDA